MTMTGPTSEPGNRHGDKVLGNSSAYLISEGQKVDEEANATYNWKDFYHPNPGEVLNGRYKLLAKLGWGRTATVWMAEDLSIQRAAESKRYRAVKINANYCASQPDHWESLVLERIFVRGRGRWHPGRQHVIEGLDAFLVEQADRWPHMCLVMELMRETLATQRRRLSVSGGGGLHPANVKLMKSIVKQVLQGLHYLHSECGIVHTDLREENILMTCESPGAVERFVQSLGQHPMPRKEYPDHTVYKCYRGLGDMDEALIGNMVAKIADFGLSHVAHARSVVTMPIQPDSFRAPEVILGAGWSYSADMWNLAALVWHLFADSHIFTPIVEDEGVQIYDAALHLAQMTEVLGPAPSSLIERAEALAEHRFPTPQRNEHTGTMCATARDLYGGPFYHGWQGLDHWQPDFAIHRWRCLRDEVPRSLGHEAPALLAFLGRMTCWEPRARATAGEMLADVWLSRAALEGAAAECRLRPVSMW